MLTDLFGAVVRTVVNVAALPLDACKDVLTLGGELTGDDESATARRIRILKDEAGSGDTGRDDRRAKR